MQEIGRPIRIRGTNFDGSPHWLHAAYLVAERGGLVITRTPPGTIVETERGPWESGYHTRGHYWADRWYNIIRLDTPHDRETPVPEAFAGIGGDPGRPGDHGSRASLFGFYCNVSTPVQFDGQTVHYADLQLDVLVRPQGDELRYEVRDEDEFQQAIERYGYNEKLIKDAWAAVEQIIHLVEARAFPFDI